MTVKTLGMSIEHEWMLLTKLGLFETVAILAGRPEMKFMRRHNRIEVTWLPKGVTEADLIYYKYFDHVYFNSRSF